MIKILLICSIVFETIGFSGISKKIDQTILASSADALSVVASENQALPEIPLRPRVRAGAPAENIFARNYLLAEADSGAVLAKQDQHEQVPIASTTKIMTAVVVLENYNLDDVVTVSPRAASQIGALINLRSGENITVRNLLNGLLIQSGNDTAYALAEHMNGSGEQGIGKFVGKMNEKALSLGMINSDYRDPAGLDTTGYSSAYDLFLVTKYALKNPVFAEIVRTKERTVYNTAGTIAHTLKNSNRLVGEWDYPGAIGVKTGYMPEAGHCLVGAAKRGDTLLISIVLKTNADTPTASAEESRKLLDWGFENIIWE